MCCSGLHGPRRAEHSPPPAPANDRGHPLGHDRNAGDARAPEQLGGRPPGRAGSGRTRRRSAESSAKIHRARADPVRPGRSCLLPVLVVSREGDEEATRAPCISRDARATNQRIGVTGSNCDRASRGMSSKSGGAGMAPKNA